MNVHGYEFTNWEVSNIGHTAHAERLGKKYFLKRYGEHRNPTRGPYITQADYLRLSREFDSFRNYREDINRACQEISGPGGNILAPLDWFVEGNFYIEATEWVENTLSDDDVLALPFDDKYYVMLTAAAALYNIHRKNIVHGDLKRTNIIVAKNNSGKIVAKLIDFDRSYFADRVRRMELGGDYNFMSPELGCCMLLGCTEDGKVTADMQSALAELSTKSDIFSLGLVFHDYLASGNHPKVEGLSGELKKRADAGKPVYCFEALLSGGRLVVSDLIKDKYLRHIIGAMLQFEPTDRPTALDVLYALKSKKELPMPGTSVRIEGESEPVSDTPASEIAAKPASDDSSKSVSDTAEKPASDAAAKPTIPVGYCSPWEEHSIEFCPDQLALGGYVAAERANLGSSKLYALYKVDGQKQTLAVDAMLLLGLAKRIGTPKPAPAPAAVTPLPIVVYEDGAMWEFDAGYKFDLTAVRANGFTNAARAEKNGVKGYAVIKADGSKTFYNPGVMKLLGYVVKV